MALPTPDASAYTNFIRPTRDLMDWAQARLAPPTPESWSLANFPGTNYDMLFDFVKWRLSTGDRPALITVYTGSEYGYVPRRTGTFSVLCLMKYPRKRDEAQLTVMDLSDEVVSLIDNQIYYNMRARVVFDRGLDFRGTEINCIETGFKLLDH